MYLRESTARGTWKGPTEPAIKVGERASGTKEEQRPKNTKREELREHMAKMARL